MMFYREATLLCLLPWVVESFSPNLQQRLGSQVQQKQQRASRFRLSHVVDDKLTLEDSMDLSTGNVELDSSGAFARSLADASPSDIFSEMEGSTESLEMSETVNAVLAASERAAAEAEDQLALSSDLGAETFLPTISDPVDFSNEGDSVDMSETVSAILAASELAAAEAEATLPDDIVESVPIMPRMPGNDTVGAPVSLEKPATITSASEVVGEPVTAVKVSAPSIGKIIKFAIPAVGVWLCSPLLSLIDTSAVGVLSGTVQQAALNPAVAVTDYAALLIAFMYTGTTNLIAAAQESDRTVAGKPRTTKTLIGALQLSTYVGLSLGSILFIFARPLLRTIIGNDGISPAVFSAAMKYVRIRALGMPAAAFIGSAQAACLGMQDIKSPLYVLFAAAVVNFLGDMIFVGSTNPLIGGAAGAAWATVVSQYAAVAVFMKWLTDRKADNGNPKVMNLTKGIMELTGKPSSEGDKRLKRFRSTLASFRKTESQSGTNKPNMIAKSIQSIRSRLPKKEKNETSKKQNEDITVRGFLANKISGKDLVKFPDRSTVQEIAPYVVPVTTTQIGRVSGYVAMSHVVSSSLGTIGMAAQQVIVSLFYCLCPIADSLSLTAQSFLPGITEKAVSKERASALKKASMNFLKAGAVFSAAMVAAVGCIPLMTHFFTADPSVIALTNSIVPLLLGFFSVHGALCAAEGLLLGQKDLGFLGKMYAGFFAAVPYFMLRVKRAALMGGNVTLSNVWGVFLSYQIFRFCAWLGRVAIIQRRTDREAAATFA